MTIHLRNLKCIFVLIAISAGSYLNAQELPMVQDNNHFDWSTGSSGIIALEDALDQMNEEHNVFFTYDISVVKNIVVSNENSRKGKLERNLESLLYGSGLTFEKIGSRNYAIIHSAKKTASSDEKN